MRIIAVTNAKGGSGKTTTTVNVAAALGEMGRRVLVVDLDPQRNASTWLGAGRGAGPTLADALAGEAVTGAELALESSAEGVAIIPAAEDLATVERRIRVSGGGGADPVPARDPARARRARPRGGARAARARQDGDGRDPRALVRPDAGRA